MMYNSYDDAYLMHHGIKGMHWGVRRYQNEDGTLTNAGKRRERRQQAKLDRQARKDAAYERKRAYRNRSLMSERELDDQIRRYQKEQQFKRMSAQSIAPGRSAVVNNLSKYGSMAAGAAIGTATGIVVKNALANAGLKVNFKK